LLCGRGHTPWEESDVARYRKRKSRSGSQFHKAEVGFAVERVEVGQQEVDQLEVDPLECSEPEAGELFEVDELLEVDELPEVGRLVEVHELQAGPRQVDPIERTRQVAALRSRGPRRRRPFTRTLRAETGIGAPNRRQRRR
jgi:hypothetical protein